MERPNPIVTHLVYPSCLCEMRSCYRSGVQSDPACAAAPSFPILRRNASCGILESRNNSCLIYQTPITRCTAFAISVSGNSSKISIRLSHRRMKCSNSNVMKILNPFPHTAKKYSPNTRRKKNRVATARFLLPQ